MKIKKAHFIGIAGKGMSATALLLRESGVIVTGSDEGFYPPVSDYLLSAGIRFSNGYNKDNIPNDADAIVVGRNAKLTPQANDEVRAAVDSGLPVYSFPDIISDITRDTDNIVVVGSYGKSTCTALMAWVLKENDLDPSYFIGEVTNGFAAYAHRGRGPTFVLEGDEYPSSHWDNTSKFLHYNAKSVILTSAAHDHVNVFPTHESYLAPFRCLLARLPNDGTLVVNGGDKFALNLAAKVDARINCVTYGIDDNSAWYPKDIQFGQETKFQLCCKGNAVTSCSTTLLGMHNVENIVGVSTMLLERELVTAAGLRDAVASFKGVKRRLECLSQNSMIPVYEGFGSSYEKALSAIAAMRLHFRTRRLLVVFEPHTFTWRNASAVAYYDDVFVEADKVFIFSPASQGAETHSQLTHSEIVKRVLAAGVDCEPILSAEHGLEICRRNITENDAVLLLTSGSLGGLTRSIPLFLEESFPL